MKKCPTKGAHPRSWTPRNAVVAAICAVLALSFVHVAPASAQFSDRYQFLRAIEKLDVNETRSKLDAGVYVNTHNSDGVSALVLAAEKGGPSWAALLLKYKANPDIRNTSDGRTALMYFAERGDKLGVDLMLSVKASPDVQDELGETALMKAVRSRDLRIVQRLLEVQPDLYITDATGRDVFDIARETRGGRRILQELEKAS